jgi:hypothetical protein
MMNLNPAAEADFKKISQVDYKKDKAFFSPVK